MFNTAAAAQIVNSGMLNVVRRVLFTKKDTSATASVFDLDYFFQFGTGIVLISQGTVYALIPSHVIRHATNGNKYANDSPFWMTTRHDQPNEVTDFLMPMRMHDCAPGGNDAIDAAFVEMNPMIFNLGSFLDWDNEALFCAHGESIQGATAMVLGYPEEVNEYSFLDRPDGSVKQVANIKQACFDGLIREDSNGCIFVNFKHKEGYAYPGVSGSVVVCSVNGQLKYLGIVLGGSGGRFKILKFAEIRRATGDLSRLPWEVLDRAYFMQNPTHSGMNYSDFQNAHSQISNITRKYFFAPKRSNDFLEQVNRSLKSPCPQEWDLNLDYLLMEASERVKNDLVKVLISVSKIKTASA